MTKPIERLCADDFKDWAAGNATRIGDFTVTPKRDFGSSGAKQPGCAQPHGWIVTRNGCLATPGGIWAYSREGGARLIHAMIAAGYTGTVSDAPEAAQRVHSLLALTRETGLDWRISEAMREQSRFAGPVVANAL